MVLAEPLPSFIMVIITCTKPCMASSSVNSFWLTLTAAMRSEEAHLREKFGDAYDAYAEKRARKVERRFSWQRAIYNREHHTIAGLLTGLLLLSAKLL